MGLPFLGAIPLHPEVRALGDAGRPPVLEHPASEYGKAFTAIAGQLARRVSILAYERSTATAVPSAS
jgi:ATP-binding protein involved in chromosome partitioning